MIQIVGTILWYIGIIIAFSNQILISYRTIRCKKQQKLTLPMMWLGIILMWIGCFILK